MLMFLKIVGYIILCLVLLFVLSVVFVLIEDDFEKKHHTYYNGDYCRSRRRTRRKPNNSSNTYSYRRKLNKPASTIQYTKPSQPTATTDSSYEQAFARIIGQSPLAYIMAKIDAGSEMKAIKYAYEITADAIARQSNTTSNSFLYYYEKLSDDYKNKIILESETRMDCLQDNKPNNHSNNHANNTWNKPIMPSNSYASDRFEIEAKKELCLREILYEKNFFGYYKDQLVALYTNADFMRNMAAIIQMGSLVEFHNDPFNRDFKNFKVKTIPNEFTTRHMNENRFAYSIIKNVNERGQSENSAMISIYYAIRYQMLLDASRNLANN